MSKEDLFEEEGTNRWIVVLVFVGLIIIVLLSVIAFKGFSFTGNAINIPKQNKTICKDILVSYEEQEEYVRTEYYNVSVPKVNRNCNNIDLKYSISNLSWIGSQCSHEISICRETDSNGVCLNESSFCDDIELKYKADVNNLDNQGGYWTLNFNFNIVVGMIERKLINQNVLVTDFVNAGSSRSFIGITHYHINNTSDLEQSRSYSVNITVNSVPTKEVCNEETKYNNVQQQRQVTAYRPVAKNRTEQRCE